MGTKHALEHFTQSFNWDYATRATRLSSVPGTIEIHEFDYLAEITEEAWSVEGIRPPPAREGGPATEMTEAILRGRWDTMDVERRMMQDYADQHGIDMQSIMEQAK